MPSTVPPPCTIRNALHTAHHILHPPCLLLLLLLLAPAHALFADRVRDPLITLQPYAPCSAVLCCTQGAVPGPRLLWCNDMVGAVLLRLVHSPDRCCDWPGPLQTHHCHLGPNSNNFTAAVCAAPVRVRKTNKSTIVFLGLTSHASERLKLVFGGTNSGHGCVHGGQ